MLTSRLLSARLSLWTMPGRSKTLSRDGQMTDAEIEPLIERLGEKKRALDEVRDFSWARQALKELQGGK